ncbi:MAG: DUF4976 domain-containing protein, partial [Chloroflexi bacterium]|nr:DUF4976 domain-containing protein [Chloroflexota bacterium]
DGTVHRDFLYFSHESNRGLRVGNWMLVSATEDGDAWELYDLSTDRAEMHNLAARHPEHVRAMAEQWQCLHEEFLGR